MQEVAGSIPAISTQFNICRGSSGVERFSEKEEVGGSIPPLGTICGYRIVVITSGCQSDNEGSTPSTRSSNKRKLLTNILCCVSM